MQNISFNSDNSDDSNSNAMICCVGRYSSFVLLRLERLRHQNCVVFIVSPLVLVSNQKRIYCNVAVLHGVLL